MAITIEFDDEGYLLNLEDWSPDSTLPIAAHEDLELTPEHWELIYLIREFYATYQHSPAMRPLVKAVKIKFGADKGNSLYLLKLFPGSPAKRLAKIAGLPKPSNCL